MIKDWIKKRLYKKRSKQVADYYNEWSLKILNITDTFQGFRTENINETHAHTVKTSGIKNGMKILDAGCGVGGPAFYLAANLKSEIYALTNSPAQIDIIAERNKNEKLSNLNTTLGDYHEITASFQPAFFDAVLFLESLGHSYYPEKVIANCFLVLKPGGILYIRDHFRVKGNNRAERRQLDRLTREGDDTYVYNHTWLWRIEAAIKDAGFQIQLVQKPPLQFFNINPEFEKMYGIKSPNGYFIDTYEIRALKP